MSVHPTAALRHVVQTVLNIIARNARTSHLVSSLTNAPSKTVLHKDVRFSIVLTARTQAHALQVAITHPAVLIARNKYVTLVLVTHNVNQPKHARNTTLLSTVFYMGLALSNQLVQTTIFARTQVLLRHALV